MRSCVTVNQSVTAISRPTKSFSERGVSTTSGGMKSPYEEAWVPRGDLAVIAAWNAPEAWPTCEAHSWRSILRGLRPAHQPIGASAHPPRLRREMYLLKLPRRRAPEWSDPE